MTGLADFSSPDKLTELVDKLTDGGKRSHRFENMSIQNICTWKNAGLAPVLTIDVYGFPADEPLYIYQFERSEHQLAQLHVRTPTQGHNRAILAEGLKKMIQVGLPFIEKLGDELLVDGDTVVREEFFKLVQSGELPFEIKCSGDLFPFYMDERQKGELLEMNLTAPDDFKIDQIDVEGEYEPIHAALFYADDAQSELTRLRLAHLPSVCIRDLDGDLASWQMALHYGQLTHLYTVPKHRGKGIGPLTELLLSQKFAKAGLQVFKYVDYDNEAVFRGTMRHQLWTRWVSTNEGNATLDGEEEIMWTWCIFKLVKAK